MYLFSKCTFTAVTNLVRKLYLKYTTCHKVRGPSKMAAAYLMSFFFASWLLDPVFFRDQ